MNKVCILLIIGLFSTTNLFSQKKISVDSIKNILCKKWEFVYAQLNEKKIERISDTSKIYYIFKKNGTFEIITNQIIDSRKCSWVFENKNQIIRLFINDINIGVISLIKEHELILKIDLNNFFNIDLKPIQLVFKSNIE